MNTVNAMLIGAIALSSCVVALFFLRFWKSTRDRFFLYFAMAFFIEALNRILLGVMAPHSEDEPFYYLVRLVAYCLILFAILDKNQRRRQVKDVSQPYQQ